MKIVIIQTSFDRWNWHAVLPNGELLCVGQQPAAHPNEIEAQIEEVMTWFRADVMVTREDRAAVIIAHYAAEGSKERDDG